MKVLTIQRFLGDVEIGLPCAARNDEAETIAKVATHPAIAFRQFSTFVLAAQTAIHDLAEGETKNSPSRDEKIVDGGLRRHDGWAVGRKSAAYSTIAP